MLFPSPLLLLGLLLPSLALASFSQDHHNDPSRPRGQHSARKLRLERKLVKGTSASGSRNSSSVSHHASATAVSRTSTVHYSYTSSKSVTPTASASQINVTALLQGMIRDFGPNSTFLHPNSTLHNGTLHQNSSIIHSNTTISSNSTSLYNLTQSASVPSNQTVHTNTSLPSNSSSLVFPSAKSTSIPSPTSTISSSASRSGSSSATATTASAAVASSAATSVSLPSSNGTKAVYAHFMIGNAYPYTQATWAKDIELASKSGFDGFALNVGTDSWQSTQVASAYAAAAAFSPDFKLFISFDFTVFPCASASDAAAVVSLAALYASHPNQATYAETSRPLVSTFAGSDCTFGEADWDKGFANRVKAPLLAKTQKEMFFVPSVFSDPSTFSSVDVMDGELNWNGGWPTGNTDVSFDSDTKYLAALGSKKLIAAVSPGFFTHYSPSSWNKNWIFKSDGFLYAKRWEQLVKNRNKFDLVECVTWNDYGESSYIGPIEGAQPNSQAWVDGFDHTPLLEINAYYAEAFRTGFYPTITADKIFLTARPHHNQAVAKNDDTGRPTGGQNGPADGYTWAENKFFALVFATSAGTVELKSAASTSTFDVVPGANFLEAPLITGWGMSATLTRSSKTVVSLAPKDFIFAGTTKTYNWNYYIFSSGNETFF